MATNGIKVKKKMAGVDRADVVVDGTSLQILEHP